MTEAQWFFACSDARQMVRFSVPAVESANAPAPAPAEKPSPAGLLVALGQAQNEIGCRLYQQVPDAGCHEGSNGLAGDDAETLAWAEAVHTSCELENRIEALTKDVKRQPPIAAA